MWKMELLCITTCSIIVLVSITNARLITLRKYEAGITRIHNYYRVLERAADMQMLVWDNDLAARAAEWSENCYWGHQKKGLGENLAYQWSTGTLKQTDVIIKAIKDWYNEKYIWRWSTQCGAACHYTQMVWSTTTKIGCAYSKCSQLRTPSGPSIRNAHYFVCFYNPPGNFYGKYPFWYGNRCTKCKQKDVCQKGLCCSKERANLTKYLPKGSSMIDNLSSPEDDNEEEVEGTAAVLPRLGADKFQVSVSVKYNGQILNVNHITKKYETIIRNDIISSLTYQQVTYIDD